MSKEDLKSKPKPDKDRDSVVPSYFPSDETSPEDIISGFELARPYGDTQVEMINDTLANIRVTAVVLLGMVSTKTEAQAQNTIDWINRQIKTLREISASGERYDAGLFNDAAKALGELFQAIMERAAKEGWELKIRSEDVKDDWQKEILSPFIPWDELEPHF